MITGTHAILYSDHAEEIRAFFRDVLKFPSVDAGHGWLIFALPPAELGIHPASEGSRHELFLMCDDIEATVAGLESRGVKFTRGISDARFGLLTSISLPGGAQLGLYQPKHPLAPAWPAANMRRANMRGAKTRRRKRNTKRRSASARRRSKKRKR